MQEEQREQAPVLRYPITRNVKSNETITWYLEEDWLTQFKTTVTNYLGNGRYKTRAHRRFAENVLALANDISDSQTKDTRINNELLPLLQTKTGLVEKGWNGKKSFLYIFCDFTHQNYFEHKRIERTNARIEAQYADEKLRLQNSNQELTRQLATLAERYSTLNKKLLEEQADSEEAQRLSTACLDEKKREISGLEEVIASLRKELSVKTAHASDLEEKLQNKNEENELMKQHLREAAQSHCQSKQESPTKLDSVSPSPTNNVEELRKQLTVYQEENKQLKANVSHATARVGQLVQKKMRLRSSLRKEKEELGSVKRELSSAKHLRDIALNLLDRLFGTTFFEEKPSVFLRNPSHKLEFSETQVRLIRRISSAKPPEYPKIEEEITTTAAAIEEGKPVENLSDKFNASLNGGARLMQNGFGFLSNQVSKVVTPTGSPTKEGYGPIGIGHGK